MASKVSTQLFGSPIFDLRGPSKNDLDNQEFVDAKALGKLTPSDLLRMPNFCKRPTIHVCHIIVADDMFAV